VFCEIDWAEDHYDVALVDHTGVVLTERRIDDDAIGYQLLLAFLAEHGDDQGDPIPVTIETPRGLVVACLRRTGRQVYAVNPLSVARDRERHSVARTKSDRVDAQLLANILRTDRAAHRPLPADSELAQAVAVLARAQQDAVWNRQQVANQLPSLLREYYPAFLEAFKDRRPGGLAHPDACAVLAIAPTPTQAARLTRPQLQAALRRAGRQRGIAAASIRLQAIFRRTWLHQLPIVEDAMGHQALALLKQLEAAAQAADGTGGAASGQPRSTGRRPRCGRSPRPRSRDRAPPGRGVSVCGTPTTLHAVVGISTPDPTHGSLSTFSLASTGAMFASPLGISAPVATSPIPRRVQAPSRRTRLT
jgi:Transposase